jgi:hypothetical protein
MIGRPGISRHPVNRFDKIAGIGIARNWSIIACDARISTG